MTYWPDHPSSANQKRFEDDLKGSVSKASFMLPSCAEKLPKLNEQRATKKTTACPLMVLVGLKLAQNLDCQRSTLNLQPHHGDELSSKCFTTSR